MDENNMNQIPENERENPVNTSSEPVFPDPVYNDPVAKAAEAAQEAPKEPVFPDPVYQDPVKEQQKIRTGNSGPFHWDAVIWG